MNLQNIDLNGLCNDTFIAKFINANNGKICIILKYRYFSKNNILFH